MEREAPRFGFAFAALALILLAAALAAVAMDAAAQTAAGEHVGGAKPAEMRRVALVIGNAHYVQGNTLANPSTMRRHLQRAPTPGI